MDFQRAVQAFLWSFPAVSFESIRVGMKRDLGADLNDLIIADNFADTRGIWLTANDTTIYGMVNVDLSQGPIVLEVPAGPGVGLIDDFWQRAITDFGLPGPDKGKGGKYLLLPPGYTGEVPKEGYFVLRGTMNNYNIMDRGLVENNDIAAAVNLIKGMRVYPWSQRENPKANKVISMSGPKMTTIPPDGIEYWARLSAFINNNPVHERDRFFMAMLKPLGIEKGKEFNPDARQRAILEDAAKVGHLMARTLLFHAEQRISGATAFPGTNWVWVVLLDHDQETDNYSQLDERLHYFYGAIYMSPAIGRKTAGPGASYIQAFADKDGNHFDGGKSYRLHLPANIPVSSFWSLTLYDTETRSMIQNAPNDSARSGYDKLKTNADGSIDLYFGPKGPGAGQESNWIQTLPGKGFYPFFRFYGPKEGVFDGTWKMPDVELVKVSGGGNRPFRPRPSDDAGARGDPAGPGRGARSDRLGRAEEWRPRVLRDHFARVRHPLRAHPGARHRRHRMGRRRQPDQHPALRRRARRRHPGQRASRCRYDARTLIVRTGFEEWLEIPFEQVFFIRQLGASIWRSRRGRLNVGLDYAHASEAADFSLDGELTFQGKRFSWISTGTSSISDDSSREARERDAARHPDRGRRWDRGSSGSAGRAFRRTTTSISTRGSPSPPLSSGCRSAARGRTFLLGAGVGQSEEQYRGETEAAGGHRRPCRHWIRIPPLRHLRHDREVRAHSASRC